MDVKNTITTEHSNLSTTSVVQSAPQRSSSLREVDRGKPMWCTDCLLPFPEQRLLDHHKATVHPLFDGARNDNGLEPGQSRTPISCQQCAKAKAGCDKKRPCSRCKAKRINCCPRFARRVTKDASQQRYRAARQRASVTFWIAEAPQPNTDAQLGIQNPDAHRCGVATDSIGAQPGTSPQTVWPEGGGEALMHTPGLNGEDDMAFTPCLAAQTDGHAPNQDIILQVEPTWPPMPYQPLDEFPFRFNRSNSLSTDYLPTPARSPSDPWERQHRRSQSWAVSDGSLMSRTNPSVAMNLARDNPLPGTLNSHWHVAQCVSERNAPMTERPDFLNWLCANTPQQSSWEGLDQEVAARAVYLDASQRLAMSNATHCLGHTIVERIEAAAALRGPDNLEIRTHRHALSLGSLGLALPSEDSLRYMLFTGLWALDGYGHSQGIVAEFEANPRDAHMRRLLPLIMAQGLFLFEDQAARALALSLLELEALFVRSELGFLSGFPQDATRRVLFFKIATWSGHGHYMRMAERMYMTYFVTHDMMTNDETPPDCHESYLLDFELSMISNRSPASAAFTTVFESSEILESQCQGPLDVDKHKFRQVMLAAQGWLRATAQEISVADANSDSEITEVVVELILVIINKQVYHARQVLKLAVVTTRDQQEELSGHEVTTRLWMLRWHQLFLKVSRSQETAMSRRHILLLYSMLWLTVLADVSAIEKSARKEVGEQRPPVPAIGKEDGDIALLQIHCGQIFRLIRSTERSRPLWWPLAVYRATLLLWHSSLSPQQVENNGTIDPNLIMSADLGPFETWSSSTVAVDQVLLDDDRIQWALNREKDLHATLSLRDGSHLALDDSQGILKYGIDVLDQGPSSLLRDGVLMRLKAMQEAWYGSKEVQMEESSDSS